MDFKKTLIPAALIAALAPLAAFADHVRYDDDDGYATHHERGWHQRPHGRYEMRPVQRWVPGHYQQVWVPEQCRVKYRWYGERVRCRPGFYDSRWVPGHVEVAQQWVWVPYSPDFNRWQSPPPPYRGDQGYSPDSQGYPGEQDLQRQQPSAPLPQRQLQGDEDFQDQQPSAPPPESTPRAGPATSL